MTDKITITVDTSVSEQQAKLIATYMTEKYCFLWKDKAGFEYNPDNRHESEAELIVYIKATNNEWEFYFMDSFKQFKKGVEVAV